jgi:hypothetical protein
MCRRQDARRFAIAQKFLPGFSRAERSVSFAVQRVKASRHVRRVRARAIRAISELLYQQ